MATAVLAADGTPAAGLGHVARSSAVAVALERAGLGVRCFVLGADEPVECDGIHWRPVTDLRAARPLADAVVVVLDSYQLEPSDMEAIPEGIPIAVLQEHVAPPPGAALVIAAGADPELSGPHRLCGLEYACLRPAFWRPPQRAPAGRINRVLVTTGGGDVIYGLGAELAATAQEALPEAEVALVRGPYGTGDAPAGIRLIAAPDSLHDELLATDAVVTTGGQTLLEAAALGAPAIAVVAVENQRAQTQQLAAAGAVRVVELPPDRLTAILQELDGAPEQRGQLARHAQKAVDGRGAERVAARIAALAAITPRG